MKIEIELEDFQELYYSLYEDTEVDVSDFRKALTELIVNRVSGMVYEWIARDDIHRETNKIVFDIVKSNQDKIIEEVTNRVADTILKKKAIVEQMPKKSEINNISKEWEKYFLELVDKAIAKRFK